MNMAICIIWCIKDYLHCALLYERRKRGILKMGKTSEKSQNDIISEMYKIFKMVKIKAENLEPFDILKPNSTEHSKTKMLPSSVKYRFFRLIQSSVGKI